MESSLFPELLLKEIIGLSKEAVLITDLDRTVLFASPETGSLLEYEPELLVKQPLDTLFLQEDTRILVVPDHFTPLVKRTHTPEPVPFAIAGKGIPKSISAKFSEEEAQRSNLYFEEAPLLIEYLVKE